MRRREFIQNTSMAAAGTMLVPSLLSCASKNSVTEQTPIGLQLWTLRDIIRSDVKGVLKKVADIGYKELETYSYLDGMIFGMPYSDFNKMVTNLGMRVVSGHYATGKLNPQAKGTLSNGWELAVDDAQKIGQKYMALAWLSPDERKTLDDYKKVCELLNTAEETCKKAGITLGYHNHDFEFDPIDEIVPFFLMADELRPSIVLELDLFWAAFSNHDPIELFKKYPGRIPLWHVKDFDLELRKRNSQVVIASPDSLKMAFEKDVGSGSMDFKSIFANAKVSGMKHFFVEQDYVAVSPLESIANGYNYLRSIL